MTYIFIFSMTDKSNILFKIMHNDFKYLLKNKISGGDLIKINFYEILGLSYSCINFKKRGNLWDQNFI